MTYDVTRGMPRIDPTMPRTKCPAHHGSHVAQSYLGRERHGCYHCALAEWDAHEAATLAQARDDERIFQALYAEHERLVALGPPKCDSATVAHCLDLRDRYAARVNANRKG